MFLDFFQSPAFVVIYIGLPTSPPASSGVFFLLFFFSSLPFSLVALFSLFSLFSVFFAFFLLPPGLPLAFYSSPFRHIKMPS